MPRGKRINTEGCIARFMELHADMYTYNKVLYTGVNDPVVITCPTHGDFRMRPYVHWEGGDCPKCKQRRSNEYRKG